MIAGHNLIPVFVSCKLHDDNIYNATILEQAYKFSYDNMQSLKIVN